MQIMYRIIKKYATIRKIVAYFYVVSIVCLFLVEFLVGFVACKFSYLVL